ncbi:MAG: imidazolonepropionase [Gemmatimonadales bacterium]|nr:imidazolonepropionase [Gemmatimonadales bacterium]
MPRADLVIRDARVVSLATGPRPRRGAAMRELGVVPRADVVVRGDTIDAVLPRYEGAAARELDARGRVLLPGLVDCHTHACWTGSRVDEWERTLAGATYLEVQAAGGGIMATVRAVRAAPCDALADATRRRLDAMLAHGATTIEVKTGYGLTAEGELHMLAAIRAAAGGFPGTVVPTALLGHAIDPERRRFLDETTGATLDAIHAAAPGIAIDAFCERGAWSVDDTSRLLARARALGHPVRVHADQFTSLGMVEAALGLGAASVDHLEASTPATLARLAASSAIAVLLPACGFHLDGRFADGRSLVDRGAAVAVASNANPGSAPGGSLPFALALAVRHNRLTAAEALTAATVNAACVLGLDDRGSIAPGQRADLLLLDTDDERELAWAAGLPPVRTVVAGGRVVRTAA